MNTIDRFLFSRGIGWELARLFAVFTPVLACLVIAWWLAKSAVD